MVFHTNQYLGVIFSDGWKWSSHVDINSLKAATRVTKIELIPMREYLGKIYIYLFCV